MATDGEKTLLTEVCEDIHKIRAALARTGQELLSKDPDGNEWGVVMRAETLLEKMANRIKHTFKLLVFEEGERDE